MQWRNNVDHVTVTGQLHVAICGHLGNRLIANLASAGMCSFHVAKTYSSLPTMDLLGLWMRIITASIKYFVLLKYFEYKCFHSEEQLTGM